MSEAPSLREELDRKALETLEQMESDLESGRISLAQYSYGVGLIWSSWAGLVSKGLMPLIEIMGGKSVARETKSYLYRGDGQALVVTHDHKGMVRIEAFSPGQFPDVRIVDRSAEPNSFIAGREAYQKAVAALLSRGYCEI